jgi:hypothetical protein
MLEQATGIMKYLILMIPPRVIRTTYIYLII